MVLAFTPSSENQRALVPPTNSVKIKGSLLKLKKYLPLDVPLISKILLFLKTIQSIVSCEWINCLTQNSIFTAFLLDFVNVLAA